MPFAETLTPMAWPLCSGTEDRTYGLSPKAATLDEATPPSVQHSKAYSGFGRPNHRTENGRSPTAIIINREAKWEVEEILDSHWHWRRFQYLIKWKEYGHEHNSWESASKVSIPELTIEFHRKHSGALRHIRCMEFNNIFHPESIAPKHSNLEEGVNVRGHLHFHP